MIAQIINLSNRSAYKKLASRYSVPSEIFNKENYALEIRPVANNEIEFILDPVKNKENIFKYRTGEKDFTNIIITGDLSDFRELGNNLSQEISAETKHEIYSALENFSKHDELVYHIGNKDFAFNKIHIMGILNVTPDSFSDGGKYFDRNSAYNHAVQMINDGADIIDIGGESTRPGSAVISEDEEMDRVLPVVEKIISGFPDAIISIDTTKSVVAEEALKLGAEIVNDISGLTFDERIIEVVKERGASLIIMHIKGKPRDMQKNPFYEDAVKEIYDYLYNQSKTAFNEGIKNIFVDPGIGFGKNIEHNFEILQRLSDFKSLGFPIVIGVSRKSFLGKTLGLEPEERDTATSIVESSAIMNGARIIRTHNVKNGVQVKKILNEII